MFKIFKVHDKKTWKEYYMYYANVNYSNPETVLIKCDDDIVFIDVDQFQTYIDKRRENSSHLIAFASIINNKVPGVIQRHFGQWPDFTDEDIGHSMYSGATCERLHSSFIKNIKEFLKISRDIGPEHRTCEVAKNAAALVNINFFAILAKDLKLFQYCWENDEYDLSQRIPMFINRSNYIDPGFVVSHMSFTKQRECGFDETEVLSKYLQLSITGLDDVVDH
jgi:hypothetical protein